MDNFDIKPRPDTSTTTRELTFGERAVGLTFNPGGSPAVNEIKQACAAAIDDGLDSKAAVTILSRVFAYGRGSLGVKISYSNLAEQRSRRCPLHERPPGIQNMHCNYLLGLTELINYLFFIFV